MRERNTRDEQAAAAAQPERRSTDARRAVLRIGRLAAGGAMVLFVLAACDQPIAAPIDALNRVQAPAARGSFDLGSSGGSAAVDRDLAALRQATARFHDFQAAKDAGWNVEVTNCMDDLPAGAMGYHYGNPTYIDDPTPDVRKPELLIYEPEKNGRMRLVAVEYIIPYTLVSADTEPAPSLFGLSFHHNDAFGIWALHAWVWKENPSGMFADWNPKVTCAYAGSDVTHLGATP
ncbi:MAG: hypothetical protein P8174_04290 [Gemmatimonadota bacterium]